ncbi:MAG: DNA ligase (NAD(+)) LigA [Candidatus Altiarchaeales archaeon]|nr:DNA ligase (NAD(+)) LigA [Candidatus Altiarchaeales archaeon]
MKEHSMKISADLQKKIDLLDRYDHAYYNDKPLICDVAYDLLKDSVLRALPPSHPRLAKVGHEVSSAWPKVKHSIFMGSQNKVSTEDAIRAWVKSVEQKLGVKKPLFILQHKIDGFSLEMEYLNGRLKKGVTRGNGIVGEDITPNVKLFRQVPQVLPIQRHVTARGEGVIFKDDFDAIQKETGDRYKNPRNAASGISRRLDGSYSKYIRVIAYDVNAKVKTELEKVQALKKLGFRHVQTYKCRDIDEILKVYRTYKAGKREKLPYAVDGLVLKLDSIELQERMGVSHNRPDGQIALKFESDQALTTIKDITYQVGRTGKITPVALLEPVDLMGSTVQKATLHNFAYIEEKFIGIGAEVTLEKKGDIIPQVVDIVSPGDDYVRPDKCPSCGGPLIDDDTNFWCMNIPCRERDINRIIYWIRTLDMKGFSKSFVEKLWDMEKVRSVADLYRLKPDDLTAIDGIGASTIKSFFKTLESTSEMYMEKFITALGIPTCSKSTAAALVHNFGGDWDKISSVPSDELAKLSGFGKTSAESVCSGIKEVSSMAEDLLQVIRIKQKKQGVLTGKSFCVTGSLTSMSRKEFQDFVVENGGVSKSGVSSDLTYLVTNDPTSGSGKNAKAKKLGVEVITEDQFFELVGVKPETSKDESVGEDTDGVQMVSENLFGS